MNRKPFGKTVRQEIISAAALRLRTGKVSTAGDAIESVCDGATPGTLGGMMLNYVVNLSMTASRRLECAIEREAK